MYFRQHPGWLSEFQVTDLTCELRKRYAKTWLAMDLVIVLSESQLKKRHVSCWMGLNLPSNLRNQLEKLWFFLWVTAQKCVLIDGHRNSQLSDDHLWYVTAKTFFERVFPLKTLRKLRIGLRSSSHREVRMIGRGGNLGPVFKSLIIVD